jgi:two-component system, OmpR family, sensor kinase
MVPPEEQDETLALVGDEVARMARLVDDLMVLARAERPDFLQLGPVDLGDLAIAVLRRAETLPGPAWRAEPGVGVIRADAERLTQAALNLVTNAARYSPPGAPVTIGTALADGVATLWVADSGPGVPPEDRERILGRFVRGADRRREGTGLGLAIVAAIASAHGGILRVTEARPEGGARFQIDLPTDGASP